jgi:DNA polymerase-3 subunit beta
LDVRVSYQGGKFEMIGKNPVLFPEPKEMLNGREITLSAESLVYGISKTLFCASDDSLRLAINGVFVESDATGVNYVATDGHRLAMAEHTIGGMPKLSFVLPSQMASILKSMVQRHAEGEIVVTLGHFNMKFEFGDFQVTSIPQEGRFPNYRSVIPKDNDKTAVIDARLLKEAVSRVSLFSNQGSQLVVFEFTADTLKVTAKDVDYSTHAEETIACEYKEADFSIGIKSSFMYEMLSHITGDRSVFTFSDPMRAILIRPETLTEGEKITYLQMPISIN